MHAQRTIASGLILAAAVGAALSLGGCRGERTDNPPRQFFPDMDDQPKWDPQGETFFFADGRMMRPRVEGTVAFGMSMDPGSPARRQLLRDDDAFYRGVGEGGEPLAYMPASAIDAFRERGEDDAGAMARMIARGQQRYNIYCAVCHGTYGDGKGPAGARWSYPLPDYHEDRFRDRSQPQGTDGHIFDVILHGLVDQEGAVKMPAYGHAVNEAEAWAIVAYIRTLQASWTDDLAPLPAEMRQQLERSRRLPRATPPPVRAVEPPAAQPGPAAPDAPEPDAPPPTIAPPTGQGQPPQEGR